MNGSGAEHESLQKVHKKNVSVDIERLFRDLKHCEQSEGFFKQPFFFRRGQTKKRVSSVLFL